MVGGKKIPLGLSPSPYPHAVVESLEKAEKRSKRKGRTEIDVQ
jgi:hypothetical protein